MLHRGLGFCTIIEVVLFYQSTVKVILSVSCGEYQNLSRLHDAISGQNGGWVKTEHQGTAAFAELSAHYFWVNCILRFISGLISE